MNGDVPHAASPPGTLEETLELMNILIQENRDLKGESGVRVSCVVFPTNLREVQKISSTQFFNAYIICFPCLRSAASDQPVNEGAF